LSRRNRRAPAARAVGRVVAPLVALALAGLGLTLAAGSGRAAAPASPASAALALAPPVAPRGPASVPPAATGAPARPIVPASLGRLFFTPEERRRIDAGDAPPASAVPPPASAGQAGPAAAAEREPLPVRVDGVLRRSDGSQVVWIDGSPAEGGVTADGARARVLGDGTTVQVRRPGSGATHVLRPGQTSGSTELGEGNRFEVLR